MNYIVLDLEWNQSAKGKKYKNPKLPFEIIQVGAVKLNPNGNVMDMFEGLVRPVVYPKLHSAVKEILPFTEADLKHGKPFREVFQEFLEFCGEDYIFCTWGSQDLWQLQQNIKYHKLENPFPELQLYYDIQKLFAIREGEKDHMRTVEYAVDQFGLSKELAFHSAANDARYVTMLFQRMLEEKDLMERVSVDYYLPADNKEKQKILAFTDYEKRIYRTFATKEEAMKDKDVARIKCLKCQRSLRKKIRWFTSSTKKYYGVGECPEHGLVRGKILMKKTPDEQWVFPVKITKHISEQEFADLTEMKKQVALKRKLKRIKQGS